MGDQMVLQRIESELQAAQAEIETAETVEGSVGDSLRFGFGALYAAVQNLIAGFGDQRRRTDDLERRLNGAIGALESLKRDVHGLKVSRGRAIAAKERALAALANAEGTLGSISLH